MDSKPKILVVEDQSSIRDITETFLDLYAHFEILTAKNGVEAVRLMNSPEGLTVDLILMDIRMPQLDGIMATRQIQAFRPNVPIWALSAYSNKRGQVIAAGAERFYGKPVNYSHLATEITKRLKDRPEPNREAEIKAEITEHQNRLSFLRRRKAKLGNDAPVSLDQEVEEIEASIDILQDQLNG